MAPSYRPALKRDAPYAPQKECVRGKYDFAEPSLAGGLGTLRFAALIYRSGALPIVIEMDSNRKLSGESGPVDLFASAWALAPNRFYGIAKRACSFRGTSHDRGDKTVVVRLCFFESRAPKGLQLIVVQATLVDILLGNPVEICVSLAAFEEPGRWVRLRQIVCDVTGMKRTL